MGKNFPQVISLQERPQLVEATLQLIEASFNYSSEFKFQTDFAPLMDPSNHHNCYILINQQEQVMAHLGVKTRKMMIGHNAHTICLLGGIAVAPAERGQGHLQKLMQEVLSDHKEEAALFILWSDLEKLYRKFGFHQCGGQYEISGLSQQQNFQRTKLYLLELQDQATIKQLYEQSFSKLYTTCWRDETDWQNLLQVTSADLFIERSGTDIVAYFFMNKGQDLSNIIYEYGFTAGSDIAAKLKEISSYGKVWMAHAFIPTETAFYQFMLTPASTRLFTSLVSDLTGGRIKILEVNQIKQEVFFYFNDELLSLSIEDFLTGVWGPGPFEELDQDLKTMFISGLDSI